MTTPEKALAIRPRLDDPTTLTNGEPHPKYVEWLIQYSYKDEHPLSEFLHQETILDRLDDGAGYFDRKRVKKALGPNGPRYFTSSGPLPTKAKGPLLAQLIGVSIEELSAVVEQERDMRQKRQAMVDRCRWLPYKLLTWEEMIAGVPCPGCGRPWFGERDERDSREGIEAAHGECRASGSSFAGDNPWHCFRCCGFPSMNPEKLAQLQKMFRDDLERAAREKPPPPETPEQKAERAAMEAQKRARRIKKLESELAKLRAEEGDAPEA